MARTRSRRQVGRPCKTPGCPGRGTPYKVEPTTSHVWRKYECPVCLLRWGSAERDSDASIETGGEHGTERAAERLAEYLRAIVYPSCGLMATSQRNGIPEAYDQRLEK